MKKNDHNARRIAVNDDLDVPTPSERSSSLRNRQYECESLRVSRQAIFKAGALWQRVGKTTIIHLKDPSKVK